MASCMMAPSHYLKQCGLIIKLINKVPWHLYQWIIIKDLKIPISKMRLKLWDNFTSSPEIIHFTLFSSDNSFVLCHGGKLIFIMFIVTIFNPSDCCLLKGNKVPSPCVFWDHATGGNIPRIKPCCIRSQSHGRLWPLLKLKFGNCWLTSKCGGSSCKKKIQFRFSIPIPESSIPIPFSIPPISILIPIPELELEFSCNSNWIDPNPATCPHNTPHIPSCYNNEQTAKQTKAINNVYIYISHVNVTQTVPEISPLMPMHQDPLLVFFSGMAPKKQAYAVPPYSSLTRYRQVRWWTSSTLWGGCKQVARNS